MGSMDASLLADVLARPDHRLGPSSLGLAVIGLLFLVPGLVAPQTLLTIVGAVWLLAAVATAAVDLARASRSSI